MISEGIIGSGLLFSWIHPKESEAKKMAVKAVITLKFFMAFWYLSKFPALNIYKKGAKQMPKWCD